MHRTLRAGLVCLALSLVAGSAAAAPTATSGAGPASAGVEKVPSRAQVRAALLARRRHNLAVLHAYRVAGVFPINTTQPGEGHFLVDAHGTFCAVANLIVRDGHRDLIMAASRRNNALLFGDVKDGAIRDWILTSGFTQAEIARIQVPAPYVERPRPPIQPPKLDPIARANRSVSRYLAGIERTLRMQEKTGLDQAVDVLMVRPDLAVALVHPVGPATGTRVAEARPARHFAAPPPAR